jgi:hypothetical protein
MVVVPVLKPVTTPDEEPTVAIDGLALVQVPPPASVRVTVAAGQTDVVPEIGPGSGLTVTG